MMILGHVKARLGSRLVVVACLAGTALPARAAPATMSLTIPVEKFTLANSMEVLLHQDRTAPLVYVSVVYQVGSADEAPGKSGFAHLFEHMMFQGSKHVGIDRHFSILRSIGAQSVNGTTSSDRTHYYQLLPAHQLETALWLESDRMGYLLPALTQESFDNQREVVKNELRTNYEIVPFAAEPLLLAQALYPEGHPYRHLTIGLAVDLDSATLPDVERFFRTWYVPANATLLVAGDIDLPATKALVAKWFGTFPKLPKPKRVMPPPPRLGSQKRQVVADRLATRVRLHFAWPTPPLFAPGDAELDLVGDLLGSTFGRLNESLVRTGVARSAFARQSSRRLSSEFHITVELAPEANVAHAESTVAMEIGKLTSTLVTARELKQLRAARQVDFVLGLERLVNRGAQLQVYNQFLGDPDRAQWDLARYDAVTPEALRAAARKWLAQPFVEVVTMPGKETL